MVLLSILGTAGCRNSDDPSTWSNEKLESWFNKKEWSGGWNIMPDSSINKREFALSYFKNKDRWDKAFMFLKSNDLSKLEVNNFNIDGDNVYATVSEYMSKNEEDAKFEAHRKYIDLQYVISGEEMMGVAAKADIKEILEPYDPSKDIEFMTVSHFREYKATPDRFFIFFPSDIHRPGLKVGENSLVRKLVVKVKFD